MMVAMALWLVLLSLATVAVAENGGVSDGDVHTVSCPSVAICVTGQIARLELASKLNHLVAPHLRAGCRADLILSLTDHGNKRVNKNLATGESPISAQLHGLGTINWSQWTMGNVTPHENFWTDTNFHDMDCMHVERNGSKFVMHVDLFAPPTVYSPDDVLARKSDKFKGEPKRMLERERMHLAQWAGLYRCMDIISTAETKLNMHYNSVIKLRDDAVVLSEMRLPVALGRDLISIDMMAWGGLHDNFYLMGRQGANCFLRSFFNGYYSRHKQLLQVAPYNPERVALFHADHCKMNSTRLSPCNLPILSTIFSAKGNMWLRSTTYKRLQHEGDRIFKACPETLSLIKSALVEQAGAGGVVKENKWFHSALDTSAILSTGL